MLVSFFIIACSLLSVTTNTNAQSNGHYIPRVAHQTRHALLARARRVQTLANDIKLAWSGLLTPRDRLAKRAPKKHCTLNDQAGALQQPLGGGSGGTSLTPGSPTSAASTTKAPSSQSSSASTPATTSPPSPYQLVHSYTGNDFLNKWDFNTGNDPTHGVVNYLDRSDAQAADLAFVNDAGNFMLKVDTTPTVSDLRKSVRITAQDVFNGGLLLMDSLHMPTGCGTWPAFWSNGPNWPQNGEIDIVEGVSNYTDNQATVHTRSGCTLPPSFSSQSSFSQVATGQLVGGTNCAAAETGNQGCGVRVLDNTSFGPGFNNNGGGVFAMLWDTSGIAVYFFTRSQIPSDITSGNPNPAQWGLPEAKWPSTSCDPYTYFQDHVAIFDTTLCGDWAGSVWTGSGIPGQEQSCAQRTGVSTCEAFVLNNGASFQEAYWEIAYVKLYQLS